MEPLVITSVSAVGPWGIGIEHLLSVVEGGREIRCSNTELPLVPGFVESAFNPLVYHCIHQHFLQGAVKSGPQTAILLGSQFGDSMTADIASQRLIAGNHHNPLLFYQSVPNSILGYIAREFGLSGMMSCVSSHSNLSISLLETADIYLQMEDVDQVIMIGVEISSPRSDYLYHVLRNQSGSEEVRIEDAAVSLVIEKESTARRDGRPILATIHSYSYDRMDVPQLQATSLHHELAAAAEFLGNFASIQGLVDLAIAVSLKKDEQLQATIIDDHLGGQKGGISICCR